MNKVFEYPQINLKKTGEWLRLLCKRHGYTVKDIQEYLHISSNQAIYEWFNGHTLPSVNNLLALSDLLGVSMNDLLVDNIHDTIVSYEESDRKIAVFERYRTYVELLCHTNIVRMERHGA